MAIGYTAQVPGYLTFSGRLPVVYTRKRQYYSKYFVRCNLTLLENATPLLATSFWTSQMTLYPYHSPYQPPISQ